MKKDLMSLRRAGTLILLAVVLTIAGCSDNSILGPQPTETVQLDRAILGVVPLTAVTSVEDEKLVSPVTGDVIAIDRDVYHHEFKVEPAGVDKPELITVKSDREVVKSKQAITFEFGPDGLVFNKASKLEFQMAELNALARSAKLYYFDPKIGDWVLQAELAVKDGVVIFEIYHFSKYAISD
jgi:hypothetical protein